MPVYTRFTDRKTGEVVTLRDLDATMCEHQGILPDDRRMCFLYDFVCMVGIGILAKSEKSEITKETLEEYLASKDFSDTDKTILHYYLVENYSFEAWHGHA